MNDKINIIIADDHLLFIEGLRALIGHEPDINIADMAHDGKELLWILPHNIPDIILLDINMLGMNGLTAAVRIRQSWPGIRIIMLSTYSDEHLIEKAILDAEKLDTMTQIEQMAASGSAKRVITAWLKTGAMLREIVRDEDATSQLKFWLHEDVGHGIDLDYYELQRALRSPERGENSTPEKTFGTAAILEDDERQMGAWQKIIDLHSPIVLDKRYCSADPEEIVALADNAEITYFLLDIQNGEDKTAGIKAGQKILQKRLGMTSAQNAEEYDEPPVEIVVWSSSRDSLVEAGRQFKELIDSLPEEEQEKIKVSDDSLVMDHMYGLRRQPTIKLLIKPTKHHVEKIANYLLLISSC